MIDFITSLLSATLRIATPMLLATIGQILTQRSGVLNLGVEGMMLIGAFFGFFFAFITNNLLLGLLGALAIGGLLGLLMAFLTVTLGKNQTVSGIAIWMLGWGLSSLFLKIFFGLTSASLPQRFQVIPIPLLSEIPIAGVIFQQNILTYLSIVLAVIFGWVLFKTTLGLKIRSVGENPRAADALGISVFKIRYLCVILGAAMAGLGGAYLPLAEVGTFSELMTAGRGWIVVALVVFSKYSPYQAISRALIFGAAIALSLQIQALGIMIPYQFLLMIPYVLTLIVLAFTFKRTKPPASIAVPFKRGA